MKKIVNLIILVLFFVFALTFANKNQQLVDIQYYAGLSVQTRLFIALFVTFGVGLIFGYLISMSARLRTRGEMKKAQKQAKDAETRLQKVQASQEIAT